MTRKSFLTLGLLAAVSFLAIGSSILLAADKGHDVWLTDYKQAQAFAKKSGRPIMLLFTGSDWCPPCMAQEKEVFDTKKWQEWAAANIVPVFVDSPRKKVLDAKQKAHNAELSKKFPHNGVPTMVMLTPDGEEFERWVGYGGSVGGVTGWIKRAEASFAKAKDKIKNQKSS